MSIDLEKLLMPAGGMEFWFEADAITGVADNGVVSTWPDRSAYGRDLSCSSSKPTYSAQALNGRPAVYWNGSKNPLTRTVSISLKHLIVIAAYSSSTFPASGGPGEYAGLFAGVGNLSNAILIGNPTTNRFFDFDFDSLAAFRYRLAGVDMPETAAIAPMSNAMAVVEWASAADIAIDGISIGKDRSNADRLWNGRVAMAAGWNRWLNDSEVDAIYEYVAAKYHLWRLSSTGLPIFPFDPSWSRPLNIDKAVLAARSVANSVTTRVKSSAIRDTELTFTAAGPVELDAAVAFWNDVYGVGSFVYRDRAYSPARDVEMRFTSGIQSTADGPNSITYRFTASEV